MRCSHIKTCVCSRSRETSKGTSTWFQELSFMISFNSHSSFVKQTLEVQNTARKRKLSEGKDLRASMEQRCIMSYLEDETQVWEENCYVTSGFPFWRRKSRILLMWSVLCPNHGTKAISSAFGSLTQERSSSFQAWDHASVWSAQCSFW